MSFYLEVLQVVFISFLVIQQMFSEHLQLSPSQYAAASFFENGKVLLAQ